MVFSCGQYGHQDFHGRSFAKATVATTPDFAKLKSRWKAVKLGACLARFGLTRGWLVRTGGKAAGQRLAIFP